MTKLEGLEKRISALGERTKIVDADQEFYDGVVGRLTPDERLALSRVLGDAEKENRSPDDEAWLATRPPDQQAAVKRVVNLRQELRGKAT